MRAARPGLRGSTSPSARRRRGPRRTRWPPRRGRRRRRRRPACRAATACRAAPPRRRTRPGRRGGSSGRGAPAHCPPRHRPADRPGSVHSRVAAAVVHRRPDGRCRRRSPAARVAAMTDAPPRARHEPHRPARPRPGPARVPPGGLRGGADRRGRADAVPRPGRPARPTRWASSSSPTYLADVARRNRGSRVAVRGLLRRRRAGRGARRATLRRPAAGPRRRAGLRGPGRRRAVVVRSAPAAAPTAGTPYDVGSHPLMAQARARRARSCSAAGRSSPTPWWHDPDEAERVAALARRAGRPARRRRRRVAGRRHDAGRSRVAGCGAGCSRFLDDGARLDAARRRPAGWCWSRVASRSATSPGRR